MPSRTAPSNRPDTPMPATAQQLALLRALLLFCILFGFFYNLGQTPLFDLDEGAFSEATREMFERGDFVSTYLNGVPRYDKPILIYWAQAASTRLFGFTELGFRLPSAIAASLWVLLTAGFVKRVTGNERTALLAGIIVACSPLVTLIGKAAIADALLNLWLSASMFGIYLFHRERQSWQLLATFAFMGLGFLTKGPVAVLVPGAVSLLFFALRGDLRAWLKAVTHPLGILIFLAIALPWYVVQYLAEGQAFIDGFFFKHNLSRFSGTMEGHGGSLLYYIPIALLAAVPFTSAALKAFVRRDSLRDPLSLYLLTWFGFVLAFFSFSGTKLPHYITYGLTGLFILAALNLDRLNNRLLALLPQILFLGLLLALPTLIGDNLDSIGDAHARDMLADHRAYFSTAYFGTIAGALLISLVLVFERRLSIPTKLAIGGPLTLIAFSGLLLPVAGEIKQRPVKEAAELASAQGLDVVMWRINTPSFSVYRRQVTPRVDQPGPGDVVLTKSHLAAELPGEHEMLYRKNGISLVRMLPAAAGD